MTLKFATDDSKIIILIIYDVDNDIPYAQISKKYDITCYYIKKICSHFRHIIKDSDESDISKKIKEKLDAINVINKIPKVYVRDNKKHYEKHKTYYKEYVKARRLKIKLEKAKDLLKENHIEIISKSENVH